MAKSHIEGKQPEFSWGSCWLTLCCTAVGEDRRQAQACHHVLVAWKMEKK